MKALECCRPLDMVIHCGDVEGGEYLIEEAAGCPVEIVQGNNDYFSDLPREREFELEKYRVFLVHGHQYCVSLGHETLVEEARARGVDIVMYGHLETTFSIKKFSLLLLLLILLEFLRNLQIVY